MSRIFLTWTGCGGFEVRTDHVNFAFDPYKFGEDLDAASPEFDFIFISHEHFDHCHPKTLQRLCRGERIKQVLVSPGCCKALLHGSHEADFPLVTGRHATIFVDSGMPSAVIRLMTLTAINASVF